ncbi:hypothetical protein PR202_ga22950 [Eleusine coracana subsp. coracana]|uniref:Secreted protein n=1 Tax=Eleusine coracana subsp. coracana TaxID=191504 RepID=A0AAV5D4J9_ELECO|nr:hypothetical protein PR202_ga22950 [Eleusine coracana subsp. coracana]
MHFGGATLLYGIALACGSHVIGKFPQHVLLYLSGGRLGQVGTEHHRFRHHVPGHAVTGPGDDVGGGNCRRILVLKGDEGTGHLAPELVGPRDDRRLAHRRVAVQHRFDLDAADVLPAADNHVLGSVADLDVPVRVHDAHVARVEPPVVAYRGVGGLVVVEVAEHDAPAAQHDLAHRLAVARHATAGLVVDDVDRGRARRGHALPRLEPRALRRREPVPLLPLPHARDHQPGRLGEPVPVADLEPDGLNALQNRGRRRRASREDAHLLPCCRDAGLGRGGVGQHVEHDGRAAEVGHPVASDGRVHGRGGDAAEAHVGAAHHGHPPGEAPPVGMEHGQRPQVRGPRRHGPVRQPVHGHEEHAAVALDHALGRRRRPRGVVQDHRVPLARRADPRELRVALLLQEIIVCHQYMMSVGIIVIG